MGSVLCDAFRERARADVAFRNKTGVRGELLAGDVRRRALYQVLPFAGPVVKLELTGKDLAAAVEGSLAPSIGTAPALEVSGLTVRFDSRKPAGHRAVEVKVNGQPLELERVYTVATSTFLAGGGDSHVAFNAGKNRVELEGTLLDALIAKFQGKTVEPPTREARWADVAR